MFLVIYYHNVAFDSTADTKFKIKLRQVKSCLENQSFNVQISASAPVASPRPDTSDCGSVMLNAGIAPQYFQNTQGTTASIHANQTGIYWVELSKG